MNNKKFEFKIEKGHLIVGDDEIYLNWVNSIGIRDSIWKDGELAIHVETIDELLELYYTGTLEEVSDAFVELSNAIIEKYPVFHSLLKTELVNFRNIQEISHPSLLNTSQVKIVFKRGEELICDSTKEEYKEIKTSVKEFKESRKGKVEVVNR